LEQYIKCIDKDKLLNFCYGKSLTEGKIYEVISSKNSRIAPYLKITHYRIIDDMGELSSYPSQNFEPLPIAIWREIQINKLLENV
jgi:hypothetical protein